MTLCDALFDILRHRTIDADIWYSDLRAMRWWDRVERRWRALGGDRLHDDQPALPGVRPLSNGPAMRRVT